MNKTTTQLIADLRHTVSMLEAANNGPTGRNIPDTIKGLEETIKGLKKKLVTMNKSRGQYQGMFERKNKHCLRLQSENKKLLQLVESLKEEIKLQGFLTLYEDAIEHVTILKVENQSLREYIHGHTIQQPQ